MESCIKVKEWMVTWTPIASVDIVPINSVLNNSKDDIYLLTPIIYIYIYDQWIFWYLFFQDNVFVNVVASVQYRVLADKASDAFYKLSNPRIQIQAYVFDGMIPKFPTQIL